ncbi:hypothetical protein FN846DRAFT_891483 [Sphaerosporella brunnea]|uniref:Uncharacterized protein n=1 Tax=Sphaerosporella brunnea TaxID=1250544 RepID=A0A5J5ETJ4_9PEZI|nr:hypothetical protein FN846DRAFT_891483 [Sphaerosporella brunnea]
MPVFSDTETDKLMATAFAREKAALADERAALAEERAALAMERAAVAEERASLAKARAAFAEERAAVAEERASIVKVRAFFAADGARFERLGKELTAVFAAKTDACGENKSGTDRKPKQEKAAYDRQRKARQAVFEGQKPKRPYVEGRRWMELSSPTRMVASPKKGMRRKAAFAKDKADYAVENARFDKGKEQDKAHLATSKVRETDSSADGGEMENTGIGERVRYETRNIASFGAERSRFNNQEKQLKEPFAEIGKLERASFAEVKGRKRAYSAEGKELEKASFAKWGEIEKTRFADKKATSAEQRKQNRPGVAEDRKAAFAEEAEFAVENARFAKGGEWETAAVTKEKRVSAEDGVGYERQMGPMEPERTASKTANDGINRQNDRYWNDRDVDLSGDFNNDDSESNDYKMRWDNRTEYTTADDDCESNANQVRLGRQMNSSATKDSVGDTTTMGLRCLQTHVTTRQGRRQLDYEHLL